VLAEPLRHDVSDHVVYDHQVTDMTPIVGDLIRVLSRQEPHVGCYVLRVQGVNPEYLLGVNRYGLELMVATHPDPRFARVDVLSTNWALRALACVYGALRAAIADEVGCAKAMAGSAWDEDTVVVGMEAA